MKRFKILLVICVIALSCTPMLYTPHSPDPAEQEQLLVGRKLYVKHCSGCHNLYLPKQFTAEVWKDNLDNMQTRAKITPEDKELILRFLTK